MHAEHMPPRGLELPDEAVFVDQWFHKRQYLPQSEVELPEPAPPEKVERGALATGSV